MDGCEGCGGCEGLWAVKVLEGYKGRDEEGLLLEWLLKRLCHYMH